LDQVNGDGLGRLVSPGPADQVRYRLAL